MAAMQVNVHRATSITVERCSAGPDANGPASQWTRIHVHCEDQRLPFTVVVHPVDGAPALYPVNGEDQ